MTEPLIYDLSASGRCGVVLPDCDVPEAPLPADALLRDDLPLPEVSEIDIVRHFLRLSQMNHGVDKGFYPLGSCTMKYNPKINEQVARLPGLAGVHPYQDPETVQGAMFLMYTLQEWLKEIGGFAGVSLQPSAGAHGEMTGVLMMRNYLHDQGETQRDRVLIPDSAHGTNPATTSMSIGPTCATQGSSFLSQSFTPSTSRKLARSATRSGCLRAIRTRLPNDRPTASRE